MRLVRHPDSPCEAVAAISAAAVRSGPAQLSLIYAVVRGPGDIVFPPPAEPLRTDGLWRHTCFEAFVRAPDAACYIELNFAPSGRWAAYRFDDYRQGMAPLDIAPPRIAWRETAEGFELSAVVDLGSVPDPAPAAAWQMALSAVIEEAEGRTSYWALAHGPGRADFHASAGFALTLPGP